MSATWSSLRLLALDTTSSLLSVAVGSHQDIIAQRCAPATRSSAAIMRLLDDCLAEAQLRIGNVSGLVVLRGPGSFTGIRVGLALAQGLHQSLGLEIGTLSTLDTLATAAPDNEGELVTVVSAGRHNWIVQRFGPGAPRLPIEEPTRCRDESVSELAREVPLVGFGLERIESMSPAREPGDDPPPLAGVALGMAARADWNISRLTEPLYLAPPPADPGALRKP